jgi:hypothetical protein
LNLAGEARSELQEIAKGCAEEPTARLKNITIQRRGTAPDREEIQNMIAAKQSGYPTKST